MGSFEEAVNKFGDKTIERAALVQRRTVLEIGKRVIMRTPVGNMSLWKQPRKGYVGGHLRANWQTTIGAPASGELDSVDQARPAIEMAAAVGQIVPGEDKSAFITNNAPYCVRVEEGWSTQAPSGMVGVTVAEYGAIVEKVLRETK